MMTVLAHWWEHWLVQDIFLLSIVAFVCWIFWQASRNERWERAFARLRRDRVGMISLIVVTIYLLLGLLEMLQLPGGKAGTQSVIDWLASGIPPETSYSAPFAREILASPRGEKLNGWHIFGTDVLGKDVFLQTIKACKTALIIGGLTSAIYVPLGAILGILAGYFRRRTDDVIQYIYSTLASIPEILLLVGLLMVWGKGLGNMSLALGVTGWVGLCRLIRGETMRQAEKPYVMAARALGQSHWNIVFRHLLPNVLHLVLITTVLGFSSIVLAEAILSYLGVGVPVGTASWGAMIDAGRTELGRDPIVWWNIGAAAAALFGLVLSLNLLGDSLRRAFDPRLG